MSTSYIQALETFMEIAISQEYALLRAKLELVRVKWMKVRPACTAKGMKTIVIRFFMKEPLKREEKSRTLVGNLLMRYMAARKVSSQYLSGMLVWASKDRSTSTIWRCLCSADPFC
jgi:hypothetical protein